MNQTNHKRRGQPVFFFLFDHDHGLHVMARHVAQVEKVPVRAGVN